MADAGMTVLGVAPSEESLAMGARILDAAEALGEARLVLHGFELRLRVRVVVADTRSAVTLGHVQIDQQAGHRFGARGSPPIGMRGVSMPGRGSRWCRFSRAMR